MWASLADANAEETPLAEESIHMVSDGEAGDTQLMYYPAGEYSSIKTYTRTDRLCPVVLYNNYYYYLKVATNRVEGMAHDPTDSNYWGLATQFIFAIFQAVFASFAKLGSFVISGDFFISQYGTLYYNNGSTIDEITVGYSNHSSTYGGQVPYTYFDSSDPMVNTDPASGTYKFRPTLMLNARTGDTYQNNAYVRGELHATNGTFLNVNISGQSTFGGLLKKSKTLITSNNIAEYAIYDDITQGWDLDFKKTGTFIGVADTGGITITLPGVYYHTHDSAHTPYSETREQVRALVGNTIIIYNMEQQAKVLITGNTSTSETGGATSFSLSPGQCVVLECRLRFMNHNNRLQEDIYWLRSVGYTTQ
jgi:hypothetical protein